MRIDVILLILCFISIIYATNCPNDCSQHGQCVQRRNDYFCSCNTFWEGSDCSIWRDTLTPNFIKRGNIKFMEWKFYNFTITPGEGFLLNINQLQQDYDIDVYVQIGKFPTFGDYLIKDTDIIPNITISYSDAVTAPTIFYVGLYGYRGSSDYLIWYNSTGGCLNACSQHGSCIRNSCICDVGYAGEDCSFRVNSIVPNTDYRSIYVSKGQWVYYYTELQQNGNMLLNVTQTSGDVDIFVRYAFIPNRFEWDYFDITTNTQITINILEPALGIWYFGFYGYDSSSFSFKLTVDSQCPDKCSKHGNCVGQYCDCYLEYRGEACETKRDPMNDNQIVTGYVSQYGWNYYRFSSNSANNFIIQLNHTSSVDCDIYVNLEKNPTLTEFVYKDVTSGPVTNLRIDNPGTAMWYIGINGYTTCDYRLKIFSSNQCIGGCEHGRCTTSGRCICDQGWTGTYCDERVGNLRNGVPVLNQSLEKGNWEYYQYTLLNATSQLNIAIKEHDSEGFAWLFVAAGGNPTLLSYDEADTETNTPVHRLKIEFETPRRYTTFYIGVYGSPFAVRPINYDIVVWTPPFK